MLALTGDRAEAERLMRLCDQMAPRSTPREAANADSFSATLLMLLGRRDEAVQRIESMFPQLPEYARSALRYSPEWDALRGIPRFDALVKAPEQKR